MGFPWEAGETHQKTCNVADIRTWYIPNSSLEPYYYTNPFGPIRDQLTGQGQDTSSNIVRWSADAYNPSEFKVLLIHSLTVYSQDDKSQCNRNNL
jgi:hypothetical protein